MKGKDGKEYMSLNDFAKEFEISRVTALRWMRAGELPRQYVVREQHGAQLRWLIVPEAVDYLREKYQKLNALLAEDPRYPKKHDGGY